MHVAPHIHTGITMQGQKTLLESTHVGKYKKDTESAPEELGEKGGLLIQYLWKKCTGSINDISVSNIESFYYIQRDPKKIPQGSDK